LNGDVIEWDAFRAHLKKLNTNPAAASVGMSPWHVCISACCGLNALKSDNPTQPSPFAAVVCSLQDIAWEDALVAYAAYYHSVTFRKEGGLKAVHRMNNAIGETDLFKVYLGKDFKDYIREHGNEPITPTP